jgi:hypothetical protein
MPVVLGLVCCTLVVLDGRTSPGSYPTPTAAAADDIPNRLLNATRFFAGVRVLTSATILSSSSAFCKFISNRATWLADRNLALK